MSQLFKSLVLFVPLPGGTVSRRHSVVRPSVPLTLMVYAAGNPLGTATLWYRQVPASSCRGSLGALMARSTTSPTDTFSLYVASDAPAAWTARYHIPVLNWDDVLPSRGTQLAVSVSVELTMDRS